MKEISLMIYIFVFSIACFAQNTPQISADWQKFSPDGEEFTVEVPDKLVETVTVLKDADNQNIFASGIYRTYINGVYYFIFSELSKPFSKDKFPSLSEDLQKFIKEHSSSSTPIKIAHLKGEKFEFKDSENFYHTIILVRTHQRFYTFHTIREDTSANETDLFFNSIKFHEILNQAKEQSVEELKKNVESARNNTTDLINTQSATTGNVGQGSGRSSQQAVQINNIQSRGLQINTKPRASYTLLARNYQITGMVQLRVTFLNTGEIGSINPVKRLPFGLTQAAIYAAKQINFTPAMLDGKPVTVTKQV